MAEVTIWPHISVALNQAEVEHKDALETLTELQTQLLTNQHKISALAAELQETQRRAEHYARSIPQVERVRLRTDQKLRQLREHADRVSKDLAAERRVQLYLEELQKDDEDGEQRLKTYVSEVMRRDAEGYGDSDTESESDWSVLDRSIDSLKSLKPEQTSNAVVSVKDVHPDDISDGVRTPNFPSRVLSPTKYHSSEPSLVDTSLSSLGVRSIESQNTEEGPATDAAESSDEESETDETNGASMQRPVWEESSDNGEVAQTIEEAYPPLLPVQRHEAEVHPAPQHTPRQDKAYLQAEEAACDVPQEMDARAEDYDGESNEPEPAHGSEPSSPMQYSPPRSPARVPQDAMPTYHTTSPRRSAAAVPISPAEPSPTTDEMLGLGLSQHAYISSAPAEISYANHHYPPLSTRSALVVAPSPTKSSRKTPRTPEHQDSDPLTSKTLVWTPLPPGSPTQGILGSEGMDGQECAHRSSSRRRVPAPEPAADSTVRSCARESRRTEYFKDTQSWDDYKAMRHMAMPSPRKSHSTKTLVGGN